MVFLYKINTKDIYKGWWYQPQNVQLNANIYIIDGITQYNQQQKL